MLHNYGNLRLSYDKMNRLQQTEAIMDISRFIREHKSQWTELEQLLLQLSKRKRSLQASHVNKFTELYKTASAHLATLQTHSPADETTVYLNHLVAQAHNTMYKDSQTSSTQMKEFFLHYFPSLIQARSLFVGFAFILLCLEAYSASYRFGMIHSI